VVSAFAKVGDTEGSEKWLLKMLEAGIRGDTISYTAMINACARTGDVQKAESWLCRMLEDGIEPNVITFNAMIAACAKTNQGLRGVSWLEKMKRANVLPNSFSYNSAAKPFVAKGDYRKVEELMADMRNAGVSWDDFSLTSLLHSYGNSQPKQRQAAETAFCHYVAEHPRDMSPNALSALGRVIGRSAADALCVKCGLDPKMIERNARSAGRR